VLKAHARLIGSSLLAADVLASAVVYLVALAIPELFTADPAGTPALLIPGLVASLAWPLILDQLGLYTSQRRQGLSHVFARLMVAGTLSTVLVAAAVTLFSAPVTWMFPLAVGTAQFVVLASLRVVGLTAIRAFRRRGHNTRHVLIVGSGTRAFHVLEEMQRHREWGIVVVGFLDEQDGPHDPRLPALRIHKLVELPSILKQQVIDEVIIACPRSMIAQLGPVVGTCASAGIPMTLLSDLFGDYLPPPHVTRFGSMTALSFAPVHHSRSRLIVKRLLDVVGSATALLVALPLIVIAAIAIKLTSSGPVFFRQIRCGQYGRPFPMFKLRTMTEDAEARRAELQYANEVTGPVFKMRDDPRITPAGKWLRRLSLDEIPQFWNVLRGDMSIVGPRPPLPQEVAEYETFDRRRLSMRPGITCLWQIGGRNAVDFGNWVKLDLEYIDHWSLANDLKIILRTIPAMMRGTGI
jgi:exopolysaccharide biosynthesis polyprenyl glycosylphosphotransferase